MKKRIVLCVISITTIFLLMSTVIATTAAGCVLLFTPAGNFLATAANNTAEALFGNQPSQFSATEEAIFSQTTTTSNPWGVHFYGEAKTT